MGRNVQGPKPGNSRDFIPECFDNRKDKDPVVVTIKDPTEGEKRQLMILQSELGYENGEMIRGLDGLPQVHITVEAMHKFQQRAVTKHVVSVKNYCVRGVEILDGNSLAEHGETELIAEVCLEITTGFSLTDEEKKTSEDSLALKQATIPPQNGIVENASQPTLQGNETVTDTQISLSYTSPN